MLLKLGRAPAAEAQAAAGKEALTSGTVLGTVMFCSLSMKCVSGVSILKPSCLPAQPMHLHHTSAASINYEAQGLLIQFSTLLGPAP